MSGSPWLSCRGCAAAQALIAHRHPGVTPVDWMAEVLPDELIELPEWAGAREGLVRRIEGTSDWEYVVADEYGFPAEPPTDTRHTTSAWNPP